MFNDHEALDKCHRDLQGVVDLIHSWCEGPLSLQRQGNEIHLRTNVLPHLIDVLDISPSRYEHNLGVLDMKLREMEQIISYNKKVEYLTFTKVNLPSKRRNASGSGRCISPGSTTKTLI